MRRAVFREKTLGGLESGKVLHGDNHRRRGASRNEPSLTGFHARLGAQHGSWREILLKYLNKSASAHCSMHRL